jgi:hypothetical protein
LEDAGGRRTSGVDDAVRCRKVVEQLCWRVGIVRNHCEHGRVNSLPNEVASWDEPETFKILPVRSYASLNVIFPYQLVELARAYDMRWCGTHETEPRCLPRPLTRIEPRSRLHDSLRPFLPSNSSSAGGGENGTEGTYDEGFLTGCDAIGDSGCQHVLQLFVRASARECSN